MWCAREGRWDALGGASCLSRKVRNGTVAELVELNKLLVHLRVTKDHQLVYLPIDPAKAVFATFGDAALQTKGELDCQAGLVIGVTTRELKAGEPARINLVAGRSGKIERVCGSSLIVECHAQLGATACTEWVQQIYGGLANSNHDVKGPRKHMNAWMEGQPVGNHSVLAVRADCDERLAEHLLVTDAKSLFDGLEREARGKEPRVAIAIGELKQSMAAIGMIPRWLPHNEMLADPLTKYVSKANLGPLLRTMKTGMFKLTSEADEKAHREHIKASGGNLQRLKGKAVLEDTS